jgi:hypothetical protein
VTPRRISAPVAPPELPWDLVAAECPDGLTADQHERIVDGAGIAHIVEQGAAVPRCVGAVLKRGTTQQLVPAGGLEAGWRISDAQQRAELGGRAR